MAALWRRENVRPARRLRCPTPPARDKEGSGIGNVFGKRRRVVKPTAGESGNGGTDSGTNGKSSGTRERLATGWSGKQLPPQASRPIFEQYIAISVARATKKILLTSHRRRQRAFAAISLGRCDAGLLNPGAASRINVDQMRTKIDP